MKKILSTLFLLLLYFIAVSEETDLRFSLMGKADDAISHEDWAEAERYLLEALEVNPEDPTNVLLMSNLGIVQFNMGRDSLALATLDSAVKIAPSSVTVLSNRAVVRTGTGDLNGATEDYTRITEIDSTLIEPHFYLALMALTRADSTLVRAHANHIIRLAPDSFEAAVIMSQVHTSEGRHNLALPYYTQILKLDKQPEYYAARALCNLHLDDLNAAADDIASGLALDPENAELYLYRAMLNKMRYRPDDALVDARRAVLLGMDRDTVEETLGMKITTQKN